MTHHSCDLLIVGAGPAGISAACCAAEHGLNVLVADENPTPGGQIWRGQAQPGKAEEWKSRFASSGARLLSDASIFEIDTRSSVARAELGSATGEPVAATLRYQQLLLATGARERFLPFPGWTLPGVYGAGGIQALVKGGLDVSGRRVVVAGTGPLLLAAAGLLGQHGADVRAILEQASWRKLLRFALGLHRSPAKLGEALGLFWHTGGGPFRAHHWITRAGGDGKLQWIEVAGGARRRRLRCELLACGYGLVPNTELARFAGCDLKTGSGLLGDLSNASVAAKTATEGFPGQPGAVRVDEYQRSSVEGIFAAGELCGIGGAGLSLVEGSIAGLAAAEAWGAARAHFAARDRERAFAYEMERAFAPRDELRHFVEPETIVCRCEDVQASRLQTCTNWREAKLTTRCGMGACQGRVCGAATEFLYGWSVSGCRPPIVPTRVGTLAE
jgi:NADPH-dependent 2,4-dienoyl-CoA reductase/sulfur reductase-like enzyme